jgi:DNA-binding CsgD family transcriptional regulator
MAGPQQRPDHLALGRDLYRHRRWAEAYRSFALADADAPLAPGDLELLAMSAYLTGRDDEYLKTLERAHAAFLDAGEPRRAVRSAIWLAFRLHFRGEFGRGNGWLARAQRLLDRDSPDCAEHGYLLLTVVEQHIAAGDYDAAHAAASTAVTIGEHCADVDLVACARHQQGRIRLQQGRVAEGLALLDETMVAVAGGELSPMVTGLMYCSLIDACREVFAFGRAREWTSALSGWCDAQPEMVAFTGVCLVHRAELMQLGGAWREAIQEARRAGERAAGLSRTAAAAALYQQGEVHRLLGSFAAAEEAYRAASRLGLDPQPGLGLLRLAQGRPEAAVAAIRGALAAATDRLLRARLLPARVEAAIAAGDLADARDANQELQALAQALDTEALGAIAAEAQGALDLAGGDAGPALAHLRQAFQVWQRLEAPYLAARVRERIATACSALGDHDGAAMERAAAVAAFRQLGAAPDLARIAATASTAGAAHPLTSRELQVLRLVAGGATNKTIAAELALSEKTVDRHVSNILAKLDVPSRTAATAFALRHQLI